MGKQRHINQNNYEPIKIACKICGDIDGCRETCRENVYHCSLCGTSRGNHMFMAETNLCADCLNPIGFPDYLPVSQHILYIHSYIRKQLEARLQHIKTLIG
jgi:hypothetical protein